MYNKISYLGGSIFSNCMSLTDMYVIGNEENLVSAIVVGDSVNVHFIPLVTITLNGKSLNLGQNPVIFNSRTLVPLSEIFEAFGASVEWDDETRTIMSAKDGTTIEIIIDSNEMKVGNSIKYLDVPARLVNGHVFIPLRAVSESFGYKVNWNADAWTATIENL